MNSRRTPSWLPITIVPLLGLIVLGWLLLVFSGHRSGMEALPGSDGSTAMYLRDKGRLLTKAEVERLPMTEWQAWGDRRFLGGRRGEVLWLKITLRNNRDRPSHGVLENEDFFVDRGEAWILAEGREVSLLSGEAIPPAQKVLAGREMAWPIDVPARGEQVVLLRLTDFFSAYVQPVWWPVGSDFHVARMRNALAEGIYLGGLLALFGYNALLWLRLRQRDIGWYVLYLGAAVAFMLLARAQLPALGWPLASPGLETVLTVVMALSGLFLTMFARAFLEVKAHFPRTDRYVRWWCILLLVLAASTLTTPWWTGWSWLWWTTLMLAITHVGLLGVALVSLRSGVWQARFFVLSFGCLFAGSLPMMAVWFLDSSFREAGMRGLMVGSALEMLLLSLAVADRFARAQRQLVEETEQRRMIEAAYSDELEEEVRERTRELRTANADKDRMLAVIGHDLRSPLTGLMRSADETTGEFAHDVARTGRALLLMIEDLVLWARLRAGSRMMTEHPARAVMAPAVALHHTLAEHGGVELILEVPEGLRVETDLVLAQTLVRNLLANALKFAQTRVVLRAMADADGGVYFTVGNDGPALPASVAARLAAGEDEPMTATGGMGLRLCREICRALGMSLEARSGVDGGTEFGFVMKRLANEAESRV